MRARSAVAVAALAALVLTLPVTTASAAPATPGGPPVGPGRATAPAAFVPLGITRALDTRSYQETPAAQARKLQPGESFDVPLSNWKNHTPREIPVVPADATAVVVNVTATNPTADGYLTVRRDGNMPGAPATSTLNFEAGETVSNTVTVAVDPRGAGTSPQINVYNNAGTTDVVVDILGYYIPSTPQLPGQKYAPIRPTRLTDTRVEGGRLDRGGVVSAVVARRDLGTTDARAVVLNVTAVDPSTEGYVVAHQASSPLPFEGSHVNYGPGRTVANQVVVPVGPDGTIEFFSTGSTDLVVDIVGAYGPSGTNLYSAMTEQSRLVDTRYGSGELAFSTRRLPVAGISGVPADATAVTLNMTVTEPQADGHLEVFESDDLFQRPGTSNLNFDAGRTVANGVTTGLRGDPGSVDIYHHAAGRSQLIADLTGYFVQG
ncbi:extracellular elastinolytic metalloproteinase [Streptomyces sp. TLI_053]|uniref:hypothetical protein n=1 Tax=Streptomyces sp. TLI_053 TaxID=1855352 RepID=UPI00087A52A9|nr:hypothetical protein [Streptomyces sp. TLI_053]SDS91819.1 extracellular elastinolytic metalloproteinase [Streptomyces sp. TLI_053]